MKRNYIKNTLLAMKKILIPTDFSENAINATKAAAEIARKTNAELILLHIVELPQEAMDAINPGHEVPEIIFFKQFAEQKLTEASTSPDLHGLTVYQILKLGRTLNNVTEIAETNNVDLIVMGSHGASGYKEFFVGSNAEKVVRNSEIPVLVIKNNAEELKYDNVIFATDFLVENKEALVKAISVLSSFNIKPHFLMINTPNNFKPTHIGEEIAEKFFTENNITNYEFSIYNDLDIEKGIMNFAEKIDADLIAMGTHGRKGFSRLINGSISEDIVNHSKKSILTFKI